MSQTALALSLGGITFLLSVIWGGPLVRILRMLRIGEQIRIEGPQRHFTKLGTPTMGGWLFIIPVLLITGVLNLVSILSDLTVLGNSILLPMLVMLAYAAVGAWDDWLGVRGPHRGEGMKGRWKFLLQTIIALGAALILKYGLQPPELILPNVPETLDLGIWYVPIAMFVIVGTCNAVNLTDGLDGLAGLIAATAFAAYGAIAMLQGQIFLVRFCFTVVGALFAFLWYNAHPAELFMGDTGSLALGGTLAVVALMTGHWFLLPMIAIIPFSVTVSWILQVAYFRWTKGRRLFKMAPLHHHFELSGWSETQIVQRFWLVALLSGMFGVALALV
ncbi:MAG: phospho-N-acetylmuramoyl-pentapeptide-transferase [Anaerolineaceae bacterium]|nr:MAG: phospho-N-acetylmuramoyl-pentapeptide-transferase [Anaerolineaceae bacterium]